MGDSPSTPAPPIPSLSVFDHFILYLMSLNSTSLTLFVRAWVISWALPFHKFSLDVSNLLLILSTEFFISVVIFLISRNSTLFFFKSAWPSWAVFSSLLYCFTFDFFTHFKHNYLYSVCQFWYLRLSEKRFLASGAYCSQWLVCLCVLYFSHELLFDELIWDEDMLLKGGFSFISPGSLGHYLPETT